VTESWRLLEEASAAVSLELPRPQCLQPEKARTMFAPLVLNGLNNFGRHQ
jgi:hypothetical protein